jgi:hypothetical protein
MLEGVKSISVQVIEYSDFIWLKKINEYTLNKQSFRTNFKCSDKHCSDISIQLLITDMVSQKEIFKQELIRCDGKDSIGRNCIACSQFTITIEYDD